MPGHVKEIHELAKQLAPMLALATQQDWKYEEPADPNDLWHSAPIKSSCGHKFSIRYEGKHYDSTDRIAITGDYPRPRAGGYFSPCDCVPYPDRGNWKSPDMTVATSRGIDVLVREITRRFLPAYRAAYEMVAKRVQANDDYIEKKCATVTRIANEIGCEQRREHSGELKFVLYPHIPGVHEVRINSGDSVQFEVHCDPDLVIYILKLIKEREQKKIAA